MVQIVVELEETPKPEIRVIETQDNYGKFAVEPLEPGYGNTLGNPMRRVLLTSIPGTAVTWVKIEGVLHEFSTIAHMKEDVAEFLINVKAIRLKSLAARPGKLRLEIAREGAVRAGDISVSSDFEIVNPELHLATMDSPEALLSVEFNVEQGKGYVPAGHTEGMPIGVLPVDAIYSPVRKVNYIVESTRVGQITNYERLIMDVWTDGTVNPVDAVKKGAELLLEQFFLFANADKAGEGTAERPSFTATIPMEQYNTPIEKLDLSSRTLNCLKRSNINKVGQVLEIEEADLLKIRNFGTKSLDELNDKLREFGFLQDKVAPSNDSGEQDDFLEDGDEAKVEVTTAEGL
ncbi:MAG: DNA-directed RNA polymerase subunit alpha [Chloroflexi bacterium]|nr:DNA-directed RNA polymerase subunit alpha [Chloroflexota bacterium]